MADVTLEQRLEAAKDNAVLQAQIWAQEARAQRATVLEILRYFKSFALSASRGEQPTVKASELEGGE